MIAPGLIQAGAQIGLGALKGRRSKRAAAKKRRAARTAEALSHQEIQLGASRSLGAGERENFLDQRRAEEALASRGLLQSASQAVDLSKDAEEGYKADLYTGGAPPAGGVATGGNALTALTPFSQQQFNMNLRQRLGDIRAQRLAARGVSGNVEGSTTAKSVLGDIQKQRANFEEGVSSDVRNRLASSQFGERLRQIDRGLEQGAWRSGLLDALEQAPGAMSYLGSEAMAGNYLKKKKNLLPTADKTPSRSGSADRGFI